MTIFVSEHGKQCRLCSASFFSIIVGGELEFLTEISDFLKQVTILKLVNSAL